MRRVRWGLLFLAAIVAIGAGASSVLAGSQATKSATYWNNVVTPTHDGAGTIHGAATSAWLFTGLAPKLNGALEVDLNFHAQVASVYDGGGSGMSTTLYVTVTGNGTNTFTVTLANPWRPHVAYSNAEGYGQQAFASLKLPSSLWKYAGTLTVTVKSQSNTYTTFDADGLVIGYSTLQF